MRNGNYSGSSISNNSSSVLTVPMRNGNILASTASNNALRVLTVPMRNGNVKKIYMHLLNSLSSYRTYEEWKRNST